MKTKGILSSLYCWWRRLIPAAPVSNNGIEEIRAPRKHHRQRRHLPIRVRQQAFAYSCVATCLQMIYEHFTGQRMSHRRAIQLTRCKPNGAELQSVPRIMRKLCGASSRKLRSLDQVRAAIKLGLPVLGSDETTYKDSHAVLIVGESATHFCVADPATGRIRWRTSEWLLDSDEFLVVLPKGDQRADALKKMISKRTRTRTHYYAPPIRLPTNAGDGIPRLPVATIRLVAVANDQ